VELVGTSLTKRSWVKISQIRTLSVERLGKKISRVTPEQIEVLIEGLNQIVDG
jgi:mRNA interferase MazF